MKNIILKVITCTLFFPVFYFAQTRDLKKANKYFSTQAYSQAIPHYEKAYLKDSSNKSILTNLGDCYRLTNNASGQLKCYGGLVRTGNAELIHKLYYGQALMESGRGDEAKTYFEQYTADERGKELASSFEKMKMYTKNMDAYSVESVSYNSTNADFCAVLFNSTVVFASTRNQTKWINKKHAWTNNNYLNLYTTEKSSGIDLKPKEFMGNLNSKYNDGPVCFSADFNTLYFTRNNYNKKAVSSDGTYKLKIFEATMNVNGLERVTELDFNNNDFNCAHPSISADGNTLYFASDMPGGRGGMDIYKVVKESDTAWSAPVNLGDKVNTPGNEVFPFIASNNLLYFASNGHDGLGGLDIYETKIKDGKAGRIYNMGQPVNSKDDDFGLFLGPDNKVGYISSNRKNGGMDDDIYDLTILREVKRGKEVKFITKDKDSGELLANTLIQFNEDTIRTNESGEFDTTVEEDMLYKLAVDKPDYYKFQDSVSTQTSSEDSFTKELLLEKDPKLALVGIVSDVKTGKPLDGVKMTIKELPSNDAFDTYTTTAEGDYRKAISGKKLGDKISYSVKLEKDKYVTKELIFIYDIKSPGDIKLNESIDMKMGQAMVGMDLAKMIDIKPIFFDLGKFNIRKDAAVELDKVVNTMKEYKNMYIELGSHTDCRGAAKANMSLSDKRAKASAKYIIKQGIESARIKGKGYGESKLLNDCKCEGKVQSKCSEDEHAANRRTEFIITKMK
ncbi:MAG: OmpA family protein [Sphingobacteriaceae bacterium]|nr:OmpA family protein [Sphingobacteriaceae bacterium]